MAASGLGTKRDCPKCKAKFYDLNASPVVCPKCGHTFKLDEKPSAKRAAVKPAPTPSKPKKIIKSSFDDDADEELVDPNSPVELDDLEELDDAPEVISLEEVEEHQEEDELDPNSDDAEEGMFIDDLSGGDTLFDKLDPDAGHEDDEEEEDDAPEDDDDAPPKRKKR